ncbi:MAG TPA: hypothetical protein VLI05_01445 [Candidatus Saccharimonadia bacterium]|nr:hypothetical protein [Candidatus Saccharimonadia bacterium]
MTPKLPIVVRLNHHRNPWPISLGNEALGHILLRAAEAVREELAAQSMAGTLTVEDQAAVGLVLLDPTGRPVSRLADRILATVAIGHGQPHLKTALAIACRARQDHLGGHLRVHNAGLADGEFAGGEPYFSGGAVAAAYGPLALSAANAFDLYYDLAKLLTDNAQDGVEAARRDWLEERDPTGQQRWFTEDGQPSRPYDLALIQFDSGRMPEMEPLTFQS